MNLIQHFLKTVRLSLTSMLTYLATLVVETNESGFLQVQLML